MHREGAAQLLRRAIEGGGTIYLPSLKLMEEGWLPQELRRHIEMICAEHGWAVEMELRRGEPLDYPAWVVRVRT